MKKHATIFDFISEEFKKANLPFVLVGGFAVNYYKVARQTGDVDLMICVSDFDKAKTILESGGYEETFKNELFAWFDNSKLYRISVDLLFADKETLRNIILDGKKVEIAGAKCIVPSLNHLIALKLHAIKSSPRRELIDFIDVFHLIRMNNIDFKSDGFRKMCEKYGNKEIYKKIVKSMGSGKETS